MWPLKELIDALKPVENYFRGDHIDEETVLQAWLRYECLSPTGANLRRARAALRRGATFAEAARALRVPEEGDSGCSPTNTTEPHRGADTVSATIGEGAPPWPVLEQYSKPRSSGDVNAAGARKLLGATELDPVSVLVRETAQNSWDARLTTQSPLELTYHLWHCDAEKSELLRNHVFKETRGLEALERVLTGSPWMLEISDRGTKGLGGPTRNDKPLDAGTPTNYMDLVLNMGAPRDVPKGGGTYGFGKTISYSISESETVLIWTRTADTGEDRLIGSAMGPYFEDAGSAYTGRHWWGVPVDEGDRVDPLTGADARRLASRLFRRGFANGESGTSILVVAPDFGLADPQGYVNQISKAVTRELWPKTMRHPAVHPMHIKVMLDGAEQEPVETGRHVLDRYRKCLGALRDTKWSTDVSGKSGVKVVEIRARRASRLIGHLAVATFLGGEDTNEDDAVPTRRVCLMRNEAELVVKYHRVPGTVDAGDISWVGVFKPIDDSSVDDEFAQSEPPTHDDWRPPRNQHSLVRIAFTRIREAMDGILKPRPETSSAASGPNVPVAALANALAGLMPMGGAYEAARARTGGAVRVRGVRVELGESRFLRLPLERKHRVCWAVEVRVEGDRSGPVELEAAVRIVTDGGGDVDEESVARAVGWRRVTGEHVEGTYCTLARAENCVELLVEARDDVAVAPRVRMVKP